MVGYFFIIIEDFDFNNLMRGINFSLLNLYKSFLLFIQLHAKWIDSLWNPKNCIINNILSKKYLKK